jgi:hypothetical protein
MIYLFLLETKPFKKENIDSYLKPDQKISPQISPSPKKMIASPTKNTQFSPYKRFAKRRSVVLEPNKFDDLHKIMQNSPKNVDSPKNKGKRRKSLEGEPLILLKNMELNKDEEKKNKEINNKRIQQITNRQNKKKRYAEGDITIEPAYKQSKKQKLDNNPLGNNKFMDEDEEKIIDKESSDSENSESEENYEFDDDDEVLKYEGYLYKLVENKMRKLWFKLVHRDLYFYKDQKDQSHRGMHNLSGLFVQVEQAKIFEDKKYYAFSVVYPAKTRIYFCDDEKQFKSLISNLRKATGYTNLLDIY